MTDPTYDAGGPVAPATDGGGLAGAFGPEAVAAVLSIVVVVALLGSRLAFGGASGSVPTPSPSESPRPAATPNANARLEVVVRTLLQIDGTLTEKRGQLQTELKASPFDVSNVKSTIIQINQQLPTAEGLATELTATPQGAVLGTDLNAVYADLDALGSIAVEVSPTSLAKYQANALAMIQILDRLPPLDARLRAMEGGLPDPNGSAPPSGAPSQSPALSPSVGPSATVVPPPTATPPPSSPPPATPPPSTAPPSQPSIPPASPTPGPNAITNPGFEQGVGLPWELRVSGSGQATIAQDGQQPLAGALSARIDITVPTLSPAFVSLQQGGLLIVAGTSYDVSVLARAAAPRQIRIRITGPNGQVLGSGSALFPVGTSPTPLTFRMSSIVPTDGGILAIDVGGTGETVWLDDVSFSRVGGSGP